MKLNNLSLAGAAMVLIVAPLLFAMSDTQSLPDAEVLTIAVECGSQGRVDQDHQITVTIQAPDGTNPPSYSVTQFVAAQNTSAGAAMSLALTLNQGFEPNPGFQHLETQNPRYTPPNNSNGHLTAEDIQLPAGFSVSNIKVEKFVNGKWKDNDGHLKVFEGHRKVSNTATASLPSELAYHEILLQLAQSTAQPIAVEFILTGILPSGAQFQKDLSRTFAADATLGQVVQAIGSYSEQNGLTAEYPTATSVLLKPAIDGLYILSWYFTAFEDSDTNADGFEISFATSGS